MLLITSLLFVALAVLCAILQFWAHRTRQDESIGNNPQFLKFQRGYYLVYLVAMFADWLQGPYLYKLYSYYGFQEEQIAVLYVFGFASTVILGSWTPIAADQFGRKKLCVVFTVTYSLSCLLKLSRSYMILIIGRIVGGVATSVLFSAFEAWYVHEHLETHDFPKEWISLTFAKASFWNGILAMTAGITTNIVSEWFGLGPVAPYMLAVPFLIFVGIIISTHWNENYSGHKVKFRKVCGEGFKSIVTNEKIFMIGAIEALFESVIYIIIFLWTPVLDTGHPSLGITFSSFMVCILIGQAVHQILTSRNIPVTTMLIAATVIAIASMSVCVIATHPEQRNVTVTYLALLMFEFGVGIYFPSMGFLRNHIIPETHRYSIMNWFRIPLNLISCVVLMLLHEDVFRHGNRMIFVICIVLLSLGLLCGIRFVKIAKDDENLKQDTIMTESEHIHNIF
ncbi:molybdate-anion transporter-like [Haliotis cracherodii]|uniref:molybdate-anion transporter-like n=1 Tax=Haliotis rufescens TaxID=6454 RepID=UPI00201F5B06|nr:molybdate-anion transporter-like [Haliotis rufescens]